MFRLCVHLNEQDYIDFNLFHNIASDKGKQIFNLLRAIVSLLPVAVALLTVLFDGFDEDSGLFLFIYILLSVGVFLLFRPIHIHSIKGTVKRLKRVGRLPFSSDAVIVFHEAVFTEETATNKSECAYSLIEQVYLVNDSIFYIYVNSVQAYLIPVSTFENEMQYKEFIKFIEQKSVPVKRCDFDRSPYMELRFQ